jgi:hypothetical protein
MRKFNAALVSIAAAAACILLATGTAGSPSQARAGAAPRRPPAGASPISHVVVLYLENSQRLLHDRV